MAKQIGTVGEIVGKVYARSPDGTVRLLKSGDKVFEGETLLADAASRATIQPDSGPVFSVTDRQPLALDASMSGEPPTAKESSVSTGSVDSVIQALQNGGDLNQELEATAAGLGGGGGGDGSGFVRLLRIAEATNPLAYNYAPPVIEDIQGLAQTVGGIETPATTETVAEAPAPAPSPAPSPAPAPAPVDPPAPPAPPPPEPPAPPPPEPPAPPPPPPPGDLPTVTVDLEVDPQHELLVGTSTNADTVSVVITGSDGSRHEFTATVNPDGSWTVDLTGIVFDEDVIYTATATATNQWGTATNTDIDSYDIVEPPPPPPPDDEDDDDPPDDDHEDEDDDKEDNDDDNPPDDEDKDEDDSSDDEDKDEDDSSDDEDKDEDDSSDDETDDTGDKETDDDSEDGEDDSDDNDVDDPLRPPIDLDEDDDDTGDNSNNDPDDHDQSGGDHSKHDDTGGDPETSSGQNPGNDLPVGGSPWDGETGASGKSGNGQTQDGIDTNTNQPGGNEKGQNLNPADLLDDGSKDVQPTGGGNTPSESELAGLLFDLGTKKNIDNGNQHHD